MHRMLTMFVECVHLKFNCYTLDYNTEMLDLDQVHIILNIVGSPSAEDLDSVTSEQVNLKFISKHTHVWLAWSLLHRHVVTFRAYPLDQLFHGTSSTLKLTIKVK